ncbi:hypothetical protein BURPS1655_B0012 [Burkholderia pseudomallei 1655]|nr:hypothetical protein BURPS1655_B0012 [Burkholderia pseudomallei 1655]
MSTAGQSQNNLHWAIVNRIIVASIFMITYNPQLITPR